MKRLAAQVVPSPRTDPALCESTEKLSATVILSSPCLVFQSGTQTNILRGPPIDRFYLSRKKSRSCGSHDLRGKLQMKLPSDPYGWDVLVKQASIGHAAEELQRSKQYSSFAVKMRIQSSYQHEEADWQMPSSRTMMASCGTSYSSLNLPEAWLNTRQAIPRRIDYLFQHSSAEFHLLSLSGTAST